MGLFRESKAPRTSDYDRILAQKAEMDRELEYQNNLLEGVNTARYRYEVEGDADAYIAALEHAFVQSSPPCRSSQNMALAEMYLKTGQNEKAWKYLIQLLSSEEAPPGKVRGMQAKILKKEKRYIEAIEMYALDHLHRSSLEAGFFKGPFLRDITPCVKALKWDADKGEYVAYLIDCQVKNGNYDEEAPLIRAYRSFVESISNL